MKHPCMTLLYTHPIIACPSCLALYPVVIDVCSVDTLGVYDVAGSLLPSRELSSEM